MSLDFIDDDIGFGNDAHFDCDICGGRVREVEVEEPREKEHRESSPKENSCLSSAASVGICRMQALTGPSAYLQFHLL